MRVPARQRGLSLVGLIMASALIVGLVLLGMKTLPALLEYAAVKRAVAQAAQRSTAPTEIRAAFEKAAAIEDITSIRGKDLEIVRQGDRTVVAFRYERRIPLVGNVTLLLDFDGEARSP